MKFEYHKGDLIASDEAIIAHGCNTDGVMSAGIARQISDRYTEMFWAYVDECKNQRFVPGTAMLWRYMTTEETRLIFNLGTQIRPGADARYELINLAFRNMGERMFALGRRRVAIPKIGCGIGGLVWDGLSGVEATIAEALNETEHIHKAPDFFTIAVYEL